jgi:hypothetical protein
MIKATDFFDITHSIVAITHDNASVNDVLLAEFQAMALSDEIATPQRFSVYFR